MDSELAPRTSTTYAHEPAVLWRHRGSNRAIDAASRPSRRPLALRQFTTESADAAQARSIADLSKDRNWFRVTVVLTVLLPQFAVHLLKPSRPPRRRRNPGSFLGRRPDGGIPMLSPCVSHVLPAPRRARSRLSLRLRLSSDRALVAMATWTEKCRREGRPRARALSRWRGRSLHGLPARGTFCPFLGLNVPPLGAVL